MSPEPATTPSPALLALAPPGASAALRAAADEAGYRLVEVRSVAGFLDELRSRSFTASLLSLETEGLEEELVRRIGAEPASGTLLLSAPRVSLPLALLMERVGALALLQEPLDPGELKERLRAAADEGEVTPFPAELPREGDEPTMLGSGPGMAHVFQVLARVAPTPSTVLITGESGTGKEVAARVLHWASPRREGPFVAVNCAAIPEHLLESELFGHERGAFTGAVARRVGRFERAHGGTLFLDEIGDMSLVLQAKILRVLEERRLERVGGGEEVSVDVRIVAATHRALRDRIASGDFREDLYYRLAVVEVELPPLRARGGDIRELALYYGAWFARQHGRPLRGITQAALRRLEVHDWPGNVRELRNVLERAVLLAGGEVVRARELRVGAGAPRASARGGDRGAEALPPTLTLQEVEAAYIGKVLAANDGHMGRTAEVLGIHRNTLTRKVQEYGLTGGSAEEEG